MRRPPTYRHLALEGEWPGFDLQGLLADGVALELPPLPNLAEPIGAVVAPVNGLQGPMGIAADRNGDLYYGDAAQHRILRVDCDGRTQTLPCFAGPGSGPGQLDLPRGLVIGRGRVLYVADSGNHRVQMIDLRTQQVIGLWGPSFAGEPAAGPSFGEPWDLATDSNGRVYVADAGTLGADGNRRGGALHRFDAYGAEDVAFGKAVVQSNHAPTAPIGVAIATFSRDDFERVLVLDSSPARVLVFGLDGVFDAEATDRWTAQLGTHEPRALAFGPAPVGSVAKGVLYIATAAGRVVAFDGTGALLGVVNRPATIAGLEVDCHGRLIAHPGASGTLLGASAALAYTRSGRFLSDAIEGPRDETRWQRVVLDVSLPAGTHLRVFSCVSASVTPPTLFDASGNVTADVVAPDAPDDAPLDRWRAAPLDAVDLRVLHVPGRYAWVAGILEGNGKATPILRQIRVEHDREGALGELPGFYRRDPTSQRFLDRALAVFESAYRDERAAIVALPTLFDAKGAPDDRSDGRTWLDALGVWVDARPAQEWPEPDRRERVATAFLAHAQRGTIGGLRALVRRYAGVEAWIDDAGSAPDLWQLGSGALGFGTALAPEPTQGAVVGTTALVNHSRLLRDEELGRPAWEDSAHRFHVEIMTAGGPPGALERARKVLDREKPAHTEYQLCPIEPRMRVGFQARLGIDSIVAGPPALQPLGDAMLGTDLRLNAPPPVDTVGETILIS